MALFLWVSSSALALVNPEERPATEVAPLGHVDDVTGDPDGTVRVVLDKGASLPELGKPFVVPAASAAQGGVLGVVTAIQELERGRVAVYSRRTTLDRAYSELRVSGATIDQLTGSLAAASVAFPQFHCTAGAGKKPVALSADFSRLKPTFDFDVRHREVTFLLTGSPKFSVRLTADAGGQCTGEGPKATIPIPNSPLVITIKPVMKAKLTGAVSGAFSWSPYISVGLLKDTEHGRHIHELRLGSTSVDAVESKGTASLDLGLSVGLSVAERIGIEGSAGPRLTATLSEDPFPCVNAKTSIYADVNAYADAFIKRWEFPIAKGDLSIGKPFHRCLGEADETATPPA